MSFEYIGQIGLNNIGNTCYLNSCLQLLSHSGYFVKTMFQEAINNKDKYNDVEKNILDLFLNKWIHKNKVYNPIKIQKSIAKRNSIFNIGPQNDSSESLIFLLDLFHHKPLLKIFESKFNSIRQCMKCNNTFERIETFNLLTLDVHSSINDGFQTFQEPEKMYGQVECEICKTKQEFIRTYQVDDLSDNLIIHIRRFKQNNNKYIKDNTKINIQNILDLGGYKYDLRGFIVHSGQINGGHYYFCGKNLINKWYIFNDSACYQKDINLKNFESLGYIFLYEKIKN